MDRICDDLDAETQALNAVVANLTEQQWRAPTVAEGWDSHETILHLGAADWFAHLTVKDSDAFASAHARLSAGDLSLNELVGDHVASLPGRELWQWFLDGRDAMVASYRQLDAKDRLAWIGPEIGARSMMTGRLVETWTHSHDLATSFGMDYPRTDRLRNVAHMGFVTRDFSFVNHGLAAPAEPLRLELASPTGEETWVWGPDDADNRVTATAYEFCKVLTRRLPFNDSTVQAHGAMANQWMAIAQPWIEPPRISDRA